jgi:ubiquinone/menaquinone biosynthesis C-methylase UbiE
MLGRLGALLYDWNLAQAEAACLAEWRHALLAGVRGDVLEIGAGTGLNLPHYPPAVRRLVLVEPDRSMRARLAEKVGDRSEVILVDSTAELLPLPDTAFDFAVSTLVLCSVESPLRALTEVWRVLRPGGRLLFLEHVAAEDRPPRLRWQRWLQPFWRLLGGNCHLTRRTADTIAEAGFQLEEVKRESIRKVAGVVRPSVRGSALRPGRAVPG